MHGSIRGYILESESGKPLPYASVFGSESWWPLVITQLWGGDSQHFWIATQTDTSGCFTFDQIPEGRWRLCVRYPEGDVLGVGTVQVFDDALSEVTIAVAGAARIPLGIESFDTGSREPDTSMTGSVRGYVVRAQDGAPLRDAAVTVLHGMGPVPDIAALTNNDGAFAFDGLPAGECLLRALGPGGETGEASVRVIKGAISDIVINVHARTAS
jgi:hypothetical protein